MGRERSIFDTESAEGEPLRPARVFAVILGVLDIVSCATLITYTLLWPTLPVGRFTSIPLGALIAVLFAATALPGLVLGLADRAHRVALSLALAFPVLFMVLYGALAIAAAR